MNDVESLATRIADLHAVGVKAMLQHSPQLANGVTKRDHQRGRRGTTGNDATRQVELPPVQTHVEATVSSPRN